MTGITHRCDRCEWWYTWRGLVVRRRHLVCRVLRHCRYRSCALLVLKQNYGVQYGSDGIANLFTCHYFITAEVRIPARAGHRIYQHQDGSLHDGIAGAGSDRLTYTPRRQTPHLSHPSSCSAALVCAKVLLKVCAQKCAGCYTGASQVSRADGHELHVKHEICVWGDGADAFGTIAQLGGNH